MKPVAFLFITLAVSPIILFGTAAWARHGPLPAGGGESEIDLQAITSFYNSGNYSQALERGITLLRREPSNLNAHYLLGNVFIKMGRLDDAADQYDYCYDHGPTTPSGIFARKALDAMNAAVARAAGQPPPPGLPLLPNSAQPLPQQAGGPAQTQAAAAGQMPGTMPAPNKIDHQMADIKSLVQEKGAAQLAARRNTLAGQVRHLTEDQTHEIDSVPKYIYVGTRRVSNPDYAATVQRIRDDYAEKIQLLQEDNENEERKINAFYKGLADSYDQSKPNLQSQLDDGRVGHKLVDPEPNMYVQNFAPGRSQNGGHATGVELKTQVRELPPTQGTPQTLK